ncbi:MAG: hypothetical protein JWO05_241 [Gemmatimonadetes bacterium]|nr:hypothetical protein [Gemmatimonadota bacterium]
MVRNTTKLLGVAVLLWGGNLKAQNRSCQAPNAQSNRLRELVQTILLDADSVRRADFGITSTDTSRVTVVTTDSICHQVTAVVEASAAKTLLAGTTSLIVVHYPGGYAAINPTAYSTYNAYFVDEQRTKLLFILGGE